MQAGASWRREPRRTSLAAPTLPRDATLGTSRDLPEGAMTRRQADLALLLATALWGTSFVAVKSALADATPFAFLTVRFGVAALALAPRSEEHTSELQSQSNIVCRLLLGKKKKN